MIRPTSKPRSVFILDDFQVFKGSCEKTMKPFGQPMAAVHEAELMIRDDKRSLKPGVSALYAIHQRSENRIIRIDEAVGQAKVVPMPARRKASFQPAFKAA